MARRKAIGFEAALISGHKGVTAVIVPFDPREAWAREPVPLDARREGWLVAGTVNGVAFEGWIGHRADDPRHRAGDREGAGAADHAREASRRIEPAARQSVSERSTSTSTAPSVSPSCSRRWRNAAR